MDGSKVDYVAWATGEPNFANEDENCVTMYSNSGRQDHNLLLKNFFFIVVKLHNIKDTVLTIFNYNVQWH